MDSSSPIAPAIPPGELSSILGRSPACPPIASIRRLVKLRTTENIGMRIISVPRTTRALTITSRAKVLNIAIGVFCSISDTTDCMYPTQNATSISDDANPFNIVFRIEIYSYACGLKSERSSVSTEYINPNICVKNCSTSSYKAVHSLLCCCHTEERQNLLCEAKGKSTDNTRNTYNALRRIVAKSCHDDLHKTK